MLKIPGLSKFKNVKRDYSVEEIKEEIRKLDAETEDDAQLHWYMREIKIHGHESTLARMSRPREVHKVLIKPRGDTPYEALCKARWKKFRSICRAHCIPIPDLIPYFETTSWVRKVTTKAATDEVLERMGYTLETVGYSRFVSDKNKAPVRLCTKIKPTRSHSIIRRAVDFDEKKYLQYLSDTLSMWYWETKHGYHREKGRRSGKIPGEVLRNELFTFND